MSLIILSFILLAAGILSLWIPRFIWVSGGLILAGASLATYTGAFTAIGLSALIIFNIIVYLEHKQRNKTISSIFSWGIAMIAFALCTHMIPGFHNYLWLNQVKLSSLSANLNVYLNFDKTIAACIVGLGLCYGQNNLFVGLFEKKVINRIISTGLKVSLLCIVLLMGLGLVLNYVALDFKMPSWFGLWFLSNLIFVCIAEEIVFRGYIQGKLTQYFVSKKRSWVWGLIIASVIFGLLHFRGGPIYILLAAVAGLFYGYAYHKTKRIETGILVHSLLNTVHFIFFTYPYLAR